MSGWQPLEAIHSGIDCFFIVSFNLVCKKDETFISCENVDSNLHSWLVSLFMSQNIDSATVNVIGTDALDQLLDL